MKLLTKKHTNQFINFYLICFVANYCWYFFNGITLSTLNPIFFTNKLDFTINFLMLTKIQELVASSKGFRIVLDLLFFTFPFVLAFVHYKKPKARPVLALATSIISLIYAIIIYIFTFSTNGQFIPWVLVPLTFCYFKEENFSINFNALRYIFLSMFLSAGLWKLATGAIFHVEEMSAVLLHQHAQILVDGKNNFTTSIITFFIAHKVIAYIFYFGAFIAEVSFAIGFFTKKYDKYLAIVLFAFLFLDFITMFIYYFSWVVFIGYLYFTKFEKEKSSASI